jgi:hypothetical protein
MMIISYHDIIKVLHLNFGIFLCSGYPDVGEGLPGKVQVTFSVLADNRFLVAASHIVPFNAIAVKVVKDGQTGLLFTSLGMFTIIRLTLWGIESGI